MMQPNFSADSSLTTLSMVISPQASPIHAGTTALAGVVKRTTLRLRLAGGVVLRKVPWQANLRIVQKLGQAYGEHVVRGIEPTVAA